MLIYIAIVATLILLLMIYNFMVINNGFTFTNRKIDLIDAKQMSVIKASDQVMAKYKNLTQNIIEDVKGQ